MAQSRNCPRKPRKSHPAVLLGCCCAYRAMLPGGDALLYLDSHCVCKGSHTEGTQKVRVTHSPTPFSGWLSLRIADRTAHTIQNSFLSRNVWMAAVSSGTCTLSAPRLHPMEELVSVSHQRSSCSPGYTPCFSTGQISLRSQAYGSPAPLSG